VEHALQLFANQLVEQRVDSKGKNKKLAIRKLLNAKTGNSSRSLFEFSAAGWNQVTLDYVDSVKQLSDARLAEIFDQAKAIAKKVPHLAMLIDRPLKSACSTLQSDDEGWIQISDSIRIVMTLACRLSSRFLNQTIEFYGFVCAFHLGQSVTALQVFNSALCLDFTCQLPLVSYHLLQLCFGELRYCFRNSTSL
jgi:hypothetical protein